MRCHSVACGTAGQTQTRRTNAPATQFCLRMVPGLPLQLFGVCLLDVQSARLGAGVVVNFNPAATSMSTCGRGHPDHVLSLFYGCACLRRSHRFQVKIELCRLIGLRLRIGDRSLNRAIHYQRGPKNARRQTICRVATILICLNDLKQLAAIFRLNSNICTLYRLPFCILYDALNCRGSSPGSSNRKNKPNETDV